MFYAFNGDGIEGLLIKTVVTSLKVDLIVETGTYLGSTAYFLSKNFPNIRIITIECNKTYWRKARKVLSRCGNVKQYLGTSVKILPKLDWQDVENPLFYLDAHWGGIFPLGEELRFIANHIGRAIIVIDDFQVPGKAGYAFAVNYGRESSFSPKSYGKSPEELPGVLNIAYIADFIDLANSILVLPNYTYEEMRKVNKHPVHKNLIGYVIIIYNRQQSVRSDRFLNEPLVKRYYRIQSGKSM